MTRSSLAELVAQRLNLSEAEGIAVVDAVFNGIKDILNSGERLELRGFGSFEVRKRKKRKGRIIATGKEVSVPPKDVPVFIPGRFLKNLKV